MQQTVKYCLHTTKFKTIPRELFYFSLVEWDCSTKTKWNEANILHVHIKYTSQSLLLYLKISIIVMYIILYILCIYRSILLYIWFLFCFLFFSFFCCYCSIWDISPAIDKTERSCLLVYFNETKCNMHNGKIC